MLESVYLIITFVSLMLVSDKLQNGCLYKLLSVFDFLNGFYSISYPIIKIFVQMQSGKIVHEKDLVPLIPYIPKLVMQISGSWRPRILQVCYGQIFIFAILC